MTLLDMFSGIGGFHKGLSDAGFKFKKVYFSEIDKHAIANYKYNYETAEHTQGVEFILTSGIEDPDIITFGSPCQDFSLAGKRNGLAGERSSLIEYALSAISHFRPDVFIWENVKGTFSSNDSEDFWAIIQAFANIGGYELEWQLVNTSWLLPQNRERIYLVGHLATAFRDWERVFPIGEDDELFTQKESTKKRWTQADICTAISTKERATDTFVKCRYTAGCLTGGGHSGGLHSDMELISHSVTSRYGTGGDNIHYVNNIRRLTEIECERLQGFPDNWTKFGNYDGKIKLIPKTQRYKMIGNAVTAKMVELIGKRIKENYEK